VGNSTSIDELVGCAAAIDELGYSSRQDSHSDQSHSDQPRTGRFPNFSIARPGSEYAITEITRYQLISLSILYHALVYSLHCKKRGVAVMAGAADQAPPGQWLQQLDEQGG